MNAGDFMTFEDKVVRLSRLASQLYGDLQAIEASPDFNNGCKEQHALQRIAEAFEEVGSIALVQVGAAFVGDAQIQQS